MTEAFLAMLFIIFAAIIGHGLIEDQRGGSGVIVIDAPYAEFYVVEGGGGGGPEDIQLPTERP